MRQTDLVLTAVLAAACAGGAPGTDEQTSSSAGAAPVHPSSRVGLAATPDESGDDMPPLPGWPEDAAPALKALLAGSWTPDGPEGFDEQWIDEAGLVETYTKRRAGRRIWHGLRSADGVLPVNVLIRDRQGPAVAYLYLLSYRRPEDPSVAFDEIEYADEPAVLHLRHRGRARVLFDGQLVIDAPAPAPGDVGEARAPVTLTDGFDVVLVKLGRGSDALGSSMDCELRLSDPKGDAIAMQGWNTMRASDVPSELLEQREEAESTEDESTAEATGSAGASADGSPGESRPG